MLAELRRQLTEEDAAMSTLRARLQSDLQNRRRRGASGECTESRYDVYGAADAVGRSQFDDVFRFFSQGYGTVTASSLRSAGAELGVALTDSQVKSVLTIDPQCYSAVELVGVRLQEAAESLDVSRFARWWHFSGNAAAVLLRSAWTRRQVEQARNGSSNNGRRDAAPEWTGIKQVRATASVGHVDGMEAKSSIHLAAIPSSQQNFTDVMEFLRDETKNEDGGADESDELQPEQLVAMASLRIPIEREADSDDVDECVELFRAAAEEFNAQNEFPIALRIGVSPSTTQGYLKDFLIVVFVRVVALSNKMPFVKFFAVLELLQEAGSPAGQRPFFEKVIAGIDFGTSAADILKTSGAAPVTQLLRSARAVVSASLSDEIIDAIHEYLIATSPKKNCSDFVSLFPRALQTISADAHFDTAEEVLDATLDIFEDLVLRERILKLGPEATPMRVDAAKEAARKTRTFFRGALTADVPFDARVSDLFGMRKVARLLDADSDYLAPWSFFGSRDVELAWLVHCLEFPVAESLPRPEEGVLEDKLGKNGPFRFNVKNEDDKSVPVSAVTFTDAARAVATPGNLLALVNVSTRATLVHDLTELERATGHSSGNVVVVLYTVADQSAPNGAEDLPSDEDLDKLFAEAMPSRKVSFVKWVFGSPIVHMRQAIAANSDVQLVDVDADEDEGGAGSSMKEIAKTILFAFRKVVTGPSELSFVTHDADITVKFTGIPLFNAIPKSKAEALLAVSSAKQSIKSQTYFKRVTHIDPDDDSEYSRQQSRRTDMEEERAESASPSESTASGDSDVECRQAAQPEKRRCARSDDSEASVNEGDDSD